VFNLSRCPNFAVLDTSRK